MNYNQALNILGDMALELCQRFGYDQVRYKDTSHSNDIETAIKTFRSGKWDGSLQFFNNKNSRNSVLLWNICVHPCIGISFDSPGRYEVFADMTVGRLGKEYAIRHFVAFKDSGLVWANTLMNMWNERVTKYKNQEGEKR